MIKVICIKDPNPDYSEWIFKHSGIEDCNLPIKVGEQYWIEGIFGEMIVWGESQEHLYIDDLGWETGPIPSKYFKTIDYLRDEKIRKII